MSYFRFKGKQVFYTVRGEGAPLILLHGNTASSRMFNGLSKAYIDHFQVIALDYPGHGKSERLTSFPTDFWYENAEVVVVLANHLGIERVNLLGTSGGALVALNVALEHPEIVDKIIADSFEGEQLQESDIAHLKEQRQAAPFAAKLYWWMMHGWDWRKVVDADTQMIINFSQDYRKFFHKDLRLIQSPVLMTCSEKDDLITHVVPKMQAVAEKIKAGKLVTFSTGGHPAMLSNRQQFIELTLAFLRNPS